MGERIGVMKTLDDGTKVQENDNGTSIQICKDGTRIQTNADGIIIQTNPGGSKIQRNPDGKQIDTSADGMTQIQTNPHLQDKGFRYVLSSIFAKEGIRGLYRGLLVTCFRATPAHAIMFFAYEQAVLLQ